MIRQNTQDLIDNIYMDTFPQSTATLVDFGFDRCDPTRLLGAYQAGIRRELFTPEELDTALGDGPALTKLVNRGNNNYGKGLVITTTWDNMPEEED